MPVFDPNSYETDDRGDLLPPGEYVLEVDSIERRTSMNSGVDYFNIQFRVKAPTRFSERCLWENFSLQENALWKLAELCQAVGVIEPFDTDNDRAVYNTLINAVCKAVVQHRVYNGEPKPQVRRFLVLAPEEMPPPSVGQGPAFEDDIPF